MAISIPPQSLRHTLLDRTDFIHKDRIYFLAILLSLLSDFVRSLYFLVR